MFKQLFKKKSSKTSLQNGLIFTEDLKVKICLGNSVEKIIDENFNGLWLDVEKIKTYLTDGVSLEYLVLSHWKCCFLSCLYCNDKKTDDLSLVHHFDILPVIQQLIDSNIVSKNTKIIFDCGDATLHPEFDKIMYFFINYEMTDIVIYTSAMRYCHSIAEAMGNNIAKIIVPFDCGCPYIYERIKSVNKFDIAVANIKRYIEFLGKSSKQVIMSYTLVQGINDNQKEILDWFIFFRNLGIKKFFLDIDSKWYNSLDDNLPDFLRDIIVFAQELSSFNNIEIEFSKKLKNLQGK